MRATLVAAAAAAAVVGAAAPVAQWEIAARVGPAAAGATTPAPPSSNAAAPRVDGGAAVAHVYAGLLGLAPPANAAGAKVGSTWEARVGDALPSTPLFERPVAGLVVTVAGGGRGLGGSDAATATAESATLGWTLAHAGWGRGAVAPSSWDVVPAGVPLTGWAGGALRWAPAPVGFADASVGAPAPPLPAWLGAVACTPAGVDVLAELGAVAAAGHAGASCPTFTVGDVVLDAAIPAVGQALSEAAAIVLLARGAPDVAVGAGMHLVRVVATGPEAVAAGEAAGAASPVYAAVVATLARAIAAGDAALCARFPSHRVALAVFSSMPGSGPLVPAHAHAAAAASLPRLLQTTSTSVTPVTLDDVASYQVALWTGVMLAAALLLTLYFMLGMDDVKDPALYAQIMDSGAPGGHGGGGGGGRH